MRRVAALVCLLALALVAAAARAQEQPIEGTIAGDVYRNERLGWEIAIPRGWTVMPRDEVARLENIGKDALEKATRRQIELNHTPLLHLNKDRLNRFTSTAQKFDARTDGPYAAQQDALFKAIVAAYRAKDIPVEAKRGKDTLGGLEFETMEVTFLSRDRAQVVFRQMIFDRLMTDRSLMVSFIYNNEADRASIYQALKNSTFRTRKK
jgi:hypothetical protein